MGSRETEKQKSIKLSYGGKVNRSTLGNHFDKITNVTVNSFICGSFEEYLIK